MIGSCSCCCIGLGLVVCVRGSLGRRRCFGLDVWMCVGVWVYVIVLVWGVGICLFVCWFVCWFV